MGGAQFAGSAVEVGGADLTFVGCAQVAEQRDGLVVGGRFAPGDEVVDGAPGGRLVSGQVVQAGVVGLGDCPYSGLLRRPVCGPFPMGAHGAVAVGRVQEPGHAAAYPGAALAGA